MATAISVPPLASRPTPRPIAAAWAPPRNLPSNVVEPRPALRQLQQSAPSSRARKERPCDGCRRRKAKCVMQDSRRCVLCEFHNHECTFLERAQPRKRKADDASNIDEAVTRKSPSSTTALLPRRSPTSPALLLPRPSPTSSVLPLPRPSPTSTAATSSSLSVAESTAFSARSHAPMRKPFAIDESLSLQRHRHCKYIGQTTTLDASLISLGRFDDKNETQCAVGTLRQVADGEYFSTHADADIIIPDDEARALADIDMVIGPHSSALIDIYFRNIHPSYPIIHKEAFLDRHHHGDRQFNPPLLAAMYLLALAWWEQDPILAASPKPDTLRLEYIAITSLTIAMQRPKISAVQAGLLLLQRAKSSTWTLTVQLVALGQDIGLHLDCSEWSIPQWERQLRERLAWALYMQDKWSAVVYGRPSHINAADWNVPVPTEEDFEEILSSDENEASQLSRGRIVFIHMISLTSIMAEVYDTFYSETSKAECARAGRYGTQLVLNRAKPVQIKLKDWFARLPAECKMDTSGGSSPSPVAWTTQTTMQGHLHLAYFATEISIHRRIVQSLDPVTADPYLLYICRSAAKTRLISALDFVNRLTPPHLAAFWFFASTSNFALIGTFGALLQASAPGKEEAWFYACRLREFRWTLGVSAKNASWIDAAVDLLDANTQMLDRLPEKPSASDGAVAGELGPPPLPPQPSAFSLNVGKMADEETEELDEEDIDFENEDMELDEWSSEIGRSLSSTSG